MQAILWVRSTVVTHAARLASAEWDEHSTIRMDGHAQVSPVGACLATFLCSHPHLTHAPLPGSTRFLPAASLGKMMPNKCTVLRDGAERKVDASELVPGDLVRLYIGDRVPADIRIIETSELKVRAAQRSAAQQVLSSLIAARHRCQPRWCWCDNKALPLTHALLLLLWCMPCTCLQVECSSLTGESELVPASVDAKHELPAEARNIVFMSSLAMNGEGRGIVIRTGENSGMHTRCQLCMMH